MSEQQCNSGVWCINLAPHAPNWWLGWRRAGGFLLRQQQHLPEVGIPLVRQRCQGWDDFFIGQAAQDPQRRSLLDPALRVSIHYCLADAEAILRAPRPEGIPVGLWQRLQQLCERQLKKSRGQH
ncbi:MAG: hypothetical protein Q6K99_07355 [Thermostichales cyanobacterium BF4_bins_65]